MCVYRDIISATLPQPKDVTGLRKLALPTGIRCSVKL